jgi:putative addiction module component (TIGR02574 family)
MNAKRLQAWVLRLVGTMELLAFGAVLTPHAWMEAAHGRFGLGEMPPGPVFDAVMRQVSFVYGLHGVALWVIASDVVRYRPLVIVSAVGYLLAGPVFVLIDVTAGLPWFWLVDGGAACPILGALLAGLLWADRAAAGRGETAARRELDRRVADLDADRDNVLTWEEIKARVRGQR